MAVLYGDVAFSILVLSTEKKYSSFCKRIDIFQKICFKVKVPNTFESSSEVTVSMLISQTEGYFENL